MSLQSDSDTYSVGSVAEQDIEEVDIDEQESEEVVSLKKCIERLDNENKDYNKEIQELKECIMELRLELKEYEHKMEIHKFQQEKYEFEKDKNRWLTKMLDQIQNPSSTKRTVEKNKFKLEKLDLSINRIQTAIKTYTKEHYLKGADGMAEWLINNLLIDEEGNEVYICVDKNRCHFIFVNNEGKQIVDIRAHILIDKIKPELINTMTTFKIERVNEIIAKYTSDNKVFMEQKKNTSLFENAFGSQLINRLVEKTYQN